MVYRSLALELFPEEEAHYPHAAWMTNRQQFPYRFTVIKFGVREVPPNDRG